MRLISKHTFSRCFSLSASPTSTMKSLLSPLKNLTGISSSLIFQRITAFRFPKAVIGRMSGPGVPISAMRSRRRCVVSSQANPDTLHGIFGDAQWTNKDRLSDALLKDLIEHFSSLSLGNDNCKVDILGQAYEYLIKKFADLTNKKAGEFYTPRSVVALKVF
jgi:hypothetical protein